MQSEMNGDQKQPKTPFWNKLVLVFFPLSVCHEAASSLK